MTPVWHRWIVASPYDHRWPAIRAAILERDRWVCQLCGRRIDPNARSRSPWSASVDHVVEVAAGGDWHDETNLRAAHLRCNQLRNGSAPPARQYPPRRRW